MKSLKDPWQWVIIFFFILIVGFVAIGPMTTAVHHPHAIVSMQRARVIALAMLSYANDHKGKYPTGTSSTAIFQMLLDGKYITDPTIFYEPVYKSPSSIEMTSSQLASDKVCWDVTIPVDSTTSDDLPLVFESGFRLTYAPNASAKSRHTMASESKKGVAVCYKGMNAWFHKKDESGDIPNFIPANFDPKGLKYIQLTPGGPLP